MSGTHTKGGETGGDTPAVAENNFDPLIDTFWSRLQHCWDFPSALLFSSMQNINSLEQNEHEQFENRFLWRGIQLINNLENASTLRVKM